MKLAKLMIGACALALAGCSGSDTADGEGNASNAAASTGNASMAETGSAAPAPATDASGEAMSLQPGEWEMKMEVLSVKADGLPPGAGEAMKSQSGGTSRSCMSPEEAKAPKGDVFSGNKSGACKSEGFKWEGGRIAGKTICPGGNGTGETVMTMDGRYSPQSIDMTMRTRTDLMGKPMEMEMRIAGRRVGECPAGGADADILEDNIPKKRTGG